MKNKLLFNTSDWDFSLIDKSMKAIEPLASELRLDIYPNQIEIITSEQMIDAYSSVGLPVMYKHWSFGKKFTQEYDYYRQGKRGLAYEMVLNTNPCINFLMEENSAMTQVLVLAHAAYGHNHVFKNNYLFKQWTDASSIVDYLIFARDYIIKCEEKYGIDEVEKILDAAHALMSHGVDRCVRPSKLSVDKEQRRQKERQLYIEQQVNDLWKTVPKNKKDSTVEPQTMDPEENFLYFLEKKSPILESWQREILRIVRKIAQYFEPQRMTKTLNEGWASFTHYYIVNRLWDEGYIHEGGMLEFLKLHTGVLDQPSFDERGYYGMNPYYLGFEIFNDIRRICTKPTEEDYEYFPELVNTDWVTACIDAVENYRDESLIRQFLSPTLIRKMRLFSLHDDGVSDYRIDAIHDREGFRKIRTNLANSYLTESYLPKLEIIDVDMKGTRTLTVMYSSVNTRQLSKTSRAVLAHLRTLWGYPIRLVDANKQDIK